MTRKKSNTARGLPDISVGLLSPAEMFERALPGAFIIDADLPFEARVEAVWRHLKAAYFAAEEHERLRAVLAARIAAESVAGRGEG
jgi:hypothetical protein